jgi:hypothetical protein
MDLEDLGIAVLIIVCVVGVFVTGLAVGMEVEQHDRDSAACVETCKPLGSVFVEGKCGCVR